MLRFEGNAAFGSMEYRFEKCISGGAGNAFLPLGQIRMLNEMLKVSAVEV